MLNNQQLVKYVTRAGIIAAIYIILVYAFQPISFGPGQIRIAEGLAIMPFFEAAAVPGLFVGCLLANVLGGMGIWDILGGSFISLLAAYLTNRSPNVVVGMLPPIILNAFGVSIYLAYIYTIPYWILVTEILLGQFIAVGVVGGTIAIVLARMQRTINLRRHYY